MHLEKIMKEVSHRLLDIRNYISNEEYVDASFLVGVCYQLLKNELSGDEGNEKNY
jgi:hypothetical protein